MVGCSQIRNASRIYWSTPMLVAVVMVITWGVTWKMCPGDVSGSSTIYANPLAARRDKHVTSNRDTAVHLVLTVCGNVIAETRALLTSVILLARPNTYVHIVADKQMKNSIKAWMSSIPPHRLGNITTAMYDTQFPKDNEEYWAKLFKPCATQKMFLPDILTSVHRVLFVDVDSVFMTSPHTVWALFDDFHHRHFMGLAREHDILDFGWYPKFSKIVFFPSTGLNAGVIFMDLDIMRAINFTRTMIEDNEVFKDKMVLPEQDLIGRYFYYHPENLYVVPCVYNYRSCSCGTAETEGIYILHGNGERFRRSIQPTYSETHSFFYNFDLSESRQLCGLGVESYEQRLVSVAASDQCDLEINRTLPWQQFSKQLRITCGMPLTSNLQYRYVHLNEN